MKIHFFKYQSCGNDFIIINNICNILKYSKKVIYDLCHRRFGIGGDGLICINRSYNAYDFVMTYYNSDGLLGSMCGNGGRAVCLCAKKLSLLSDNNIINFIAYDGAHKAIIRNNYVSLKMSNIDIIQEYPSYYFINTGSPHYVQFVDNIDDIDVKQKGSYINNNIYNKEHVNVNFVKIINSHTIYVRTYERGVNDETLSCGTGSVAAAIISYNYCKLSTNNLIKIVTLGGNLFVSFKKINNIFQDVWLSGDVKFVFEGDVVI